MYLQVPHVLSRLGRHRPLSAKRLLVLLFLQLKLPLLLSELVLQLPDSEFILLELGGMGG